MNGFAMLRRDFVFWTLLIIASSSELRENFTTTTGNDRRNDFIIQNDSFSNITTNHRDDVTIVYYNVYKNSTENDDSKRYKLHNNSINNDHDDEPAQHEFHAHLSMKNQENGDQMLMELRMNSTIGKSNSTSHGDLIFEDKNNLTLYEFQNEFYQNDHKINIVSHDMCENSTCIFLCCPLGNRLNEGECIPENVYSPFPDVYEYANGSLEKVDKTLDQLFQLSIHDPCKVGKFVLDPEENPNDNYNFLTNGSLLLSNENEFLESYCLILQEESSYYEIAVCFKIDEPVPEETNVFYLVGIIISLPFLLITFVIYSILSELRNMHGYTLRGYVSSLFFAYISLVVIQLGTGSTSDTLCIVLAFIIHFSFLASFFWLNVMCFDIWWTFGGFRSLQGSMKQRERKKFIIYSIYAWGCATILTIICIVMDFAPNLPKGFIRPEIGDTRCWFKTDEARAIYFYGPMGVTVICNICLFISTALKIVQHKKDTAHHLRSSESRRHDENKQWFNLYLKLFIVMGINWSMEIISWLFKEQAPAYVWYLTDLTNTLQGLIIFIIFVWKEKIKRLLLKRLGCQNRGLFCRNSTHSGCHSTTSRTCTTTSGVMSLQEKVNPYVQANCRAKSSSDEAE